MTQSPSRKRPSRKTARHRLVVSSFVALALGIACSGSGESNDADGSGGTGTGGASGGESSGGSGGEASGGKASGGVSTGGVTTGGANGGLGGEAGSSAMCAREPRALTHCWGPSSEPGEVCFTLAELEDPCHGTHLRSLHEGGSMGGQGGSAPVVPEGDGGTDLCPSADELFWGDEGDPCGCYDVPACTTPTVEKGGTCCYRAVNICRLC